MNVTGNGVNSSVRRVEHAPVPTSTFGSANSDQSIDRTINQVIAQTVYGNGSMSASRQFQQDSISDIIDQVISDNTQPQQPQSQAITSNGNNFYPLLFNPQQSSMFEDLPDNILDCNSPIARSTSTSSTELATHSTSPTPISMVQMSSNNIPGMMNTRHVTLTSLQPVTLDQTGNNLASYTNSQQPCQTATTHASCNSALLEQQCNFVNMKLEPQEPSISSYGGVLPSASELLSKNKGGSNMGLGLSQSGSQSVSTVDLANTLITQMFANSESSTIGNVTSSALPLLTTANLSYHNSYLSTKYPGIPSPGDHPLNSMLPSLAPNPSLVAGSHTNTTKHMTHKAASAESLPNIPHAYTSMRKTLRAARSSVDSMGSVEAGRHKGVTTSASATSRPNSSIGRPSSSIENVCSDADEEIYIDTRDLCHRVAYELKQFSIPQAVFAERILGRSQGTLSDLLRNPKPWNKLKSGRDTFRRMYDWLKLSEKDRMAPLDPSDNNDHCAASAMGASHGTSQGGSSSDHQPTSSCSVTSRRCSSATANTDPMSPHSSQASVTDPLEVGSCWSQSHKRWSDDGDGEMQGVAMVKRQRLVFTDIQKRTLQAIFKETQRPSREMQCTIAEHLSLDLSTVANFFMNARRRSRNGLVQVFDEPTPYQQVQPITPPPDTGGSRMCKGRPPVRSDLNTSILTTPTNCSNSAHIAETVQMVADRVAGRCRSNTPPSSNDHNNNNSLAHNDNKNIDNHANNNKTLSLSFDDSTSDDLNIADNQTPQSPIPRKLDTTPDKHHIKQENTIHDCPIRPGVSTPGTRLVPVMALDSTNIRQSAINRQSLITTD